MIWLRSCYILSSTVTLSPPTNAPKSPNFHTPKHLLKCPIITLPTLTPTSSKYINRPPISFLINSLSREERKEVAILSSNFFAEHDQEIGDIYDKLVKLRTQMAKKLGFNSFTEPKLICAD